MSVVSHTNAAGDVSLGVVIDGAYVPFVTLSAARVAQYVQRYNTLTERAAAGDSGAAAVLGTALPKPRTKGGTA